MNQLLPAGFFDYNPNPACLIRVELDLKNKPVDWTFLQCNEALAKLEGLPRSHLIGCRFFSIFPNGSRKWLKPYYEAAYLNRASAFDEISEEVGLYLHIDVFPTGERGCCVCLLRDIKADVFERAQRVRELESAVQKLDRARELNHQVQNYAEAMGILYPLAISVDLANNRYEMLQYEHCLNKTAPVAGAVDDLVRLGASTIPDAEKAREFQARFSRRALLKAFRAGEKEVVLQHPQNGNDGRVHWMETHVIAVRCDDEAAEAVTLSKCIDHEMQTEALRLEAEKASAAKTSFLRHMSHDIRTPLNGLLGLLDVMDGHPEDVKALAKERDKMRGTARCLLSLVNNVLDMSKLESGDAGLEESPFNVRDMLREAIAVLEPLMKENDISMVCSGKESFLPHERLIGSRRHLNRLLINIADNAVKYSRPGGVVTLTANETGFDAATGTARLEFVCRDNGIGMSPEFCAKRLFQPFAQEGKASRTTYIGSGLGLSLVKQLVDAMHGTITCESEEGVGTTFTVTIPFKVDPNPPAPEPAPDPAADRAVLRGRRVLLVEDNPLNAEIAAALMAREGLTVDVASDGKAAVDAFDASAPGQYDLVFMDVMMPVMDGLEATRRIRALPRSDARTVPILAMTACAFKDDVKRSLAAGMNAHLTKPLDMNAVRQAAARALRERSVS